MRSAQLAQSFLAFIYDPARAADLVGDLLERRHGNAGIGFWLEVVGTAFGGLGCALLAEPKRSLLMALGGYGIYTITGIATLACLILIRWIAPVAERPLIDFFAWPPFSLYFLASSYGAGLWVAKQSRGRELAATLFAYLLVCFIFEPSIGYIGDLVAQIANPARGQGHFTPSGLVRFDLRNQAGLIVAGIVGRSRWVRARAATLAS